MNEKIVHEINSQVSSYVENNLGNEDKNIPTHWYSSEE